ncbi:MAG: carboxypeptidase M32 [Coprothermobacterota bacterium]|nr:carboxypeptidase M32 [Coprothermobacterota bacterium]
MTKLEELKAKSAEIVDVQRAAAVLSWDQHAFMPVGGASARAEQLATLGKISHQLLVNAEMEKLLAAVKLEVEGMGPDSDDFAYWRAAQRNYDRYTKIPADLVARLSKATSLANEKWVDARSKSDFAIFQPNLEELLGLQLEMAKDLGYQDSPYDPLLDLYLELLKAIGYDFRRGRQDKVPHPFTTTFSVNDVRVTNRFMPNRAASSFFGALHEGGHALYEQGVRADFDHGFLGGGTSTAVHESQSRTWENIVGRSLPFWTHWFPALQKRFENQLRGVTAQEYWKAVNIVGPSAIRVEADEVTYNLHIILRFEIEVDLVEGRLAVKDLPQAWNAKMKESLSYEVKDDAEGVLQDVHWSMGYFGYFPGYALGNLLSVQFYQRAQADIPNLSEQVADGHYQVLLAWLRSNIHQHGSKYTPTELVQRVTGGEIDPKPFLAYLKEKYGQIYGI